MFTWALCNRHGLRIRHDANWVAGRSLGSNTVEVGPVFHAKHDYRCMPGTPFIVVGSLLSNVQDSVPVLGDVVIGIISYIAIHSANTVIAFVTESSEVRAKSDNVSYVRHRHRSPPSSPRFRFAGNPVQASAGPAEP